MKKWLLVGMVVIAALGGAWYFFGSDPDFLFDGESGGQAELSAEAREEIRGGTTEEVGADSERYTNEKYGFSFVYPETFSVSLLPELDGESILVRGENTEFQIFVSSFDEEGPITPERIRQDLPGLIIQEPQQVLVGESKDIPALIFLGESEEFGETREVWFVQGGNLYQVIAEAGQDEVVGPILETMQFQ